MSKLPANENVIRANTGVTADFGITLHKLKSAASMLGHQGGTVVKVLYFSPIHFIE
jgi:hypothetical protein